MNKKIHLLGIIFLVVVIGFSLIGCEFPDDDPNGTKGSGGGGGSAGSSGALDKNMTIQQMLQCTSGSVTIDLGTWGSMKNSVYWVQISSRTTVGSTTSGATLLAYPNYIESTVREFVITSDPYRPGAQLAGTRTTVFRYHR